MTQAEPRLPVRPQASAPSLHLRDYWHVVLRRRWLALLVLVAIVGAGVARVLLVTPRYRATAQLLIEHQAPDVLDFEKNPRAAEVWDDFYQTQYRLLQSRLLARKAVLKLELLRDSSLRGPALAGGDRGGAAGGRRHLAPDGADGRPLPGEPPRPARPQQPADRDRVRERSRGARGTGGERGGGALHPADARLPLPRVGGGGRLARPGDRGAHAPGVGGPAGAAGVPGPRGPRQTSTSGARCSNRSSKDLGRGRERGARRAGSTRRRSRGRCRAPGTRRSCLTSCAARSCSPCARSWVRSSGSSSSSAQRYLDEHPEVVKVRRQIEDTRAKIAAEARRVVRAAANDTRAAQEQESSAAGALAAAESRGARAVAPRRQVRRAEARPRGQPAPVGEPADAAEADGSRARGAGLERARDRRGGGAAVPDPSAPASATWRSRSLLALGGGPRGRVRARLLRRLGRQAGGRAAAWASRCSASSRRRPRHRGRLANGDGQEAFAEGYRVLRTALPDRRPRRRAGAARHVDARGRGQEPHRAEPGEDAGLVGRARPAGGRRPAPSRSSRRCCARGASRASPT